MNSRSSWFVYDFSDVLIRPLPRFPSQCYDPRFRFRIRSLYEVFKVQTACRAVALHAFRAASQLMAESLSAIRTPGFPEPLITGKTSFL